MPQLVITAVGPDRPGLVGDLSGKLFAAGLNLADARMVNLRGHFALLLLAEGPEAALQAVRTTLPTDARALGLVVSFAADAPAEPFAGIPYRLKTYSMDQPGIVHRVSSFLRGRGVNIEELSTTLAQAPFAGAPLFTMELRLAVPPSLAVRPLRQELEALCHELNCDVDLEPV